MAEKIECAGKSNKAHPDALTAALHQAGHQVKYQEFPGMCPHIMFPLQVPGKRLDFICKAVN
jgi:hypothetical protein